MPLLWKKSKIGRVSRFVSDLKSSSKHGESSLVVETGFPTSLVDLMIKNRDRLKKPLKKKKQSSFEMVISSPILQPPPPLFPQLTPCSLLPPHISPSSCSSSSSSNSTMLMVPSSPSTIKNIVKNHFPSCSQQEQEEEEEKIVKASAPKKGFMLLILKVLFLLILAFGTKKIAIVITISAFVLLLLEFAGKSLSCFLKPCPDAKESFNSMVDRVLISSSSHPVLKKLDETETYNKDNKIRLIEQEEEENLVGDNCGFIEDNSNNNNNNNSNGAMIIAEDGTTVNEEIQLEPGFDSLHCGCRWGFIDSDKNKKMWLSKDEEPIEDDENIKSSKKKGTVKFKSNMLKKFVPKKFRAKKKKKRNCEECYVDSRSEFVSNCVGEEDKVNRVEEHEEEEDDQDDDDQDHEEQEGDDNDVDDDNDNDQAHTSSEFSLIELDTDSGANAGKITTWSLHQLIPFVIILAGLIGGRVIALLLTVAWCLLVKSVMRTQRRDY